MSSPPARVPYLDLRAQYESIKPELLAEIERVFESSSFILGPAVERFEAAFARFCESEHCVATSNGTTAIHLVLAALGIGPGDEVITQANTFVATVSAILQSGATPVLVDVAPPGYTIDPEAVERAVTPRTRALMPVHLYGQPCDLDAIRAVARRHGLTVIEDASQAHGATYRGAVVGSGDTATFSFYPGKNLGAAGEGGGVVTHDAELARRMRLLRNHGSSVKHYHDVAGFNYRLEGIQGAVLGVKLQHLAQWTAARRRVAARYDELLASLERPLPLAETSPAWHVYPVFVDRRNEIVAKLKACGIETNVHYPVPCHLQKGYAHLGYRSGDFPHSERLATVELSLPIYPELRDEQVEYVAERLLAVL